MTSHVMGTGSQSDQHTTTLDDYTQPSIMSQQPAPDMDNIQNTIGRSELLMMSRPESNVLKNLPKILSGISQNFHLLCSSVFPLCL